MFNVECLIDCNKRIKLCVWHVLKNHVEGVISSNEFDGTRGGVNTWNKFDGINCLWMITESKVSVPLDFYLKETFGSARRYRDKF